MGRKPTFDSETVSGMHVRIPESHIRLAKISAKATDLTLAGYIDNLIVADGIRVLSDPDEVVTMLEDIDSEINELNHVRQTITDLGRLAALR